MGDSIINGLTSKDFIAPQSWAQWLAELIDMPLTKYSLGGATSAIVLEKQLPRIVRDGYDIGAVTVGANDLLYGWDESRFEKNLSDILSRLGDKAERVIVSNVPVAFRHIRGADPAINRAVSAANDVIGRQVDRSGATLLDVSDFDGPRWFHPDQVHPTALGLLEMGQRAAESLGHDRPAPDARRLGAKYRTKYARGVVRETCRVTVKRVIGRV